MGVSMHRLYRKYFNQAKRRNVFFGLTEPEFGKLTSQNCHYCGVAPLQKERNYLFNGIDRVDPHKGYETANCVPCCKECNWVKGRSLDYDEMVVVAEALRKYREKTKFT